MSKVKDCHEEDAVSFFCRNCTDKGILNALSRCDIVHFADLATIVQKYCATESAWKTQTKFWDSTTLTRTFVRAKRPNSRKSTNSIPKRPKPAPGHRTVLEAWLNGPCKLHSTPNATPTNSLRACWILRQVAKSGKDLLESHKAEPHPAKEHNTVLTVFKTFTSSNRRKRAHRSSAEICHVAKVNPWNDTAITFNASDEPQFQSVRVPAPLVLSPIVDGFRLTKVLMDGGSGLNLIYEETLGKMEIDKSRIEQSGTTFRGIIPSREAQCAENINSMWYSAPQRITAPKKSPSKWLLSTADTTPF